MFRLLTKESMTLLVRRVNDARQAREELKQKRRLEAAAAADMRKDSSAPAHVDNREDENRPKPNPALEAGRHLPSKLGEFPPELYGKPIEELDEYYHDKYVWISSRNYATQYNAIIIYFLIMYVSEIEFAGLFLKWS